MRTFRITLILSILLIVGGFVCPPIGVIDSSVLTAVGMLLAFAILAQIPTLIEAAKIMILMNPRMGVLFRCQYLCNSNPFRTYFERDFYCRQKNVKTLRFSKKTYLCIKKEDMKVKIIYSLSVVMAEMDYPICGCQKVWSHSSDCLQKDD